MIYTEEDLQNAIGSGFIAGFVIGVLATAVVTFIALYAMGTVL